jgi:uncharacterized protein (TIGR02266 family)
MSDFPRRDKRYPAKQQLLVRCTSWAEFAQVYATDVSQGGMFIATEDPPEILSEIALSLQLPEGHEIALRASVVHVLDREAAARENKQPGIGVQFIDLDLARRQQIHQLVEFARWEGTSENPTSTLASRMFEMSASLPPSRVLDALPAEPALPQAAPAQAQAQAQAPAPARTEPAASRRPRPRSPSGNVTPPAEESAPAVTAPPKPTDQTKLKLGMTHLAHKHFEQAIATFEGMVKDNPGDRQATQWLHIAHARLRLKRNDEPGAAEHYQKALDVGEDNHEARKFVREHSSKKRLSSLPFGRYFVKKP